MTMSQLSLQQELVLQQKYQQLQIVLQAGDSLDRKGMTLLQASGLIVTLGTVLSISGFVATHPSPIFMFGIGIAFVAFLLMVWLSAQAWLPRDMEVPGTRNWDEIFQDYIYEDADQCFQQILADTIESISLNNIANLLKGERIRWSVYLLIAQVGGLLLASVLVSL